MTTLSHNQRTTLRANIRTLRMLRPFTDHRERVRVGIEECCERIYGTLEVDNSSMRIEEFLSRLLDTEISWCSERDIPIPDAIMTDLGDATSVGPITVRDETFHCADCGNRFMDRDANSTYDGLVCSDCLDDDYVWSNREDTYVTHAMRDAEAEEEDEDEDEEESFSGLRDYSSNPIHALGRSAAFQFGPNEKPHDKPLWLGVELEVEPRGVGQSEAVRRAREAIDSFAICKSDGSISECGGFEICSVPGTLAFHREAWKAFFTNAKDYLRGFTAQCSCGLHVHVDKEALGTMTQGKLLAFIHSPDNREFLRRIAGRGENSWAAFYDGVKVGTVLTKHDVSAHYSAVGMPDHHPTLEIRIFKSNVSKDGFFKCLEFVHALCRYLKQASARQLTAVAFVAWFQHPSVRKDYPVLTEWLIRSGFLHVKKKAMEQSLADA